MTGRRSRSFFHRFEFSFDASIKSLHGAICLTVRSDLPWTGHVKVKKEAGTDDCLSMDEEFSSLLDFMPSSTAPTLPDWYGRSGEGGREVPSEQSGLTASPAAALTDELGIEMQQQLPPSRPAADQLWALGSCPWNNMPGIC